MRSVKMSGNEQISLMDSQEFEPKEDLVVVKIMVSAICGSELHGYHAKAPPNYEALGNIFKSDEKGWPGENAGHEGAGIVWKTDRASHLKEGDRVVLYAGTSCGYCEFCLAGNWKSCEGLAPPRYPGCHSQYVLAHERMCMPLPDDIPFAVGSLFGDGLGTPLNAIKRLGLSALDTVLIIGLGPIGFGAAMISHFYNAQVVVCDINESRLERAGELGIQHLLNPAKVDVLEVIQKLTEGRGVDKALDCSGCRRATPLPGSGKTRGESRLCWGEHGGDHQSF